MPTPAENAEFEKLSTEVKSALIDLRDAVDKKNTETVQNIESQFFKKFDELNAKQQDAILLQKKATTEAEEKAKEIRALFEKSDAKSIDLEKRVNDLLMQIATEAKAKTDDGRDSEHYKAAMECFKSDAKQWDYVLSQHRKTLMETPEMKTLRSDVGAAGGFLIPPVMDNEIRKKVTEISPVRMLVRNRTMPSKSMDVPIRDALSDSWYEGEGEPAQDTQSKYGSENVVTFRHTCKVDVTLDQLLSTPFNLEAEINGDASEAFARKEGQMFLKGTGNRQPQGILKDSRIETLTSAGSGVITFNDIAKLIALLKTGYEGVLAFNRKTLGTLRQLSDGYGRPLWTPVTDGKPAAIWGEPYTDRMIDLDAAADGSGAKPIVYADWMRSMEVFDMVGMMVVRDDLTLATSAKVRFIFRRWNTSRVLMPEAAKVLVVQ
jgi:HK97 family phage major capsid protein